MNKLNPTALAFWVFCAAIGGLINGGTGALIGLAIGTGLSLISELTVPNKKHNHRIRW